MIWILSFTDKAKATQNQQTTKHWQEIQEIA